MAHAWRIGKQTTGFNLDEPEETLLIAAYLLARRSIGQASWLREFETLFFDDDKGVPDRTVWMINGVLKASGDMAHVVRLRPGPRTAYMRKRSPEKPELRRALLSQLECPGSGRRVAEARARVLAADGPDAADRQEQEALFAEFDARTAGEGRQLRPASLPVLKLSSEETERRHRALETAAALKVPAAISGQNADASTGMPGGGSETDATETAEHPPVWINAAFTRMDNWVAALDQSNKATVAALAAVRETFAETLGTHLQAVIQMHQAMFATVLDALARRDLPEGPPARSARSAARSAAATDEDAAGRVAPGKKSRAGKAPAPKKASKKPTSKSIRAELPATARHIVAVARPKPARRAAKGKLPTSEGMSLS